jgi:hypothetical protein
MRHPLKLLLAICLHSTSVFAIGELTGFPANPYDPYCAMSCLRSFSSLMLACSGGGEHVDMHAVMTSSACWANDTPYLTSLAWCMHEKCSVELKIPNSKLERFWETDATGQQSAGLYHPSGVTQRLWPRSTASQLSNCPEMTWISMPLLWSHQKFIRRNTTFCTVFNEKLLSKTAMGKGCNVNVIHATAC